MPLYLLRRRYWSRISERLKRRGKGVISQWGAQGGGFFTDYFVNIPATIPEKMMFAELVRRQVSFKFSWYLGNIKSTYWQYEHYRPDFILIDYNIIIEVYGGYWHSRPNQANSDLVRNGLLTTMGYRVISILDADIMANVADALNRALPELVNPLIHGSTIMVGDRPIDPTAQLRARQQKYPRKVVAKYRGFMKRAKISYEAQRRPSSPTSEYGDLLIGEFGDVEYWKSYIKYTNWQYGVERGWYNTPDLADKYSFD